jgi:transposase
MRFAGIDVASQVHVVAIVDETGAVLLKPTSFGEDAAGYEKLFALLGSATDLLVAMEATGHYGRNLLAALSGKCFPVALLNPLRTRRFAQEDLVRGKTDSIDALGIARFGAQKRPPACTPRDPATDELREVVRSYDRLLQDIGDRVRQLHRLVDLCFPEFTRHVRTLDSLRATAILGEYPTAEAFHTSTLPKLTKLLRVTNPHGLRKGLARDLIEAAKVSVAPHRGEPYRDQVRYLCQDLDSLRRRRRDLESDLERRVTQDQVGSLLTTIEGLGFVSVARIIAAVGDPARFRHAGALAAYVGVVPGTQHSGLHRPDRATLCPLGNARLRRALYMATLGAVQRNPWLRAYYQRLRRKGKLPKVALIASMRKLLTAVYSVAKHRKPFAPRLTGGDDPSAD